MPRPQLKPSEEQRRLVKSMAAMGTPQEHISRKIGIRSPKTLRKYFRDELDFGTAEANYKVAVSNGDIRQMYRGYAILVENPRSIPRWPGGRGSENDATAFCCHAGAGSAGQ